MITPEERESIIKEATERALLALPETVGNLMKSHAAFNKMNSKFYADHPEFKDKKEVVSSVLEMVEGKNPLESYEEILKKAVPEIRNRLNIMGALNMKDIPTIPKKDFKGVI